MNERFGRGEKIYPVELPISLVAEETHRQLSTHLDDLVAHARGFLLRLFVIVLSPTFVLILFAAYRNMIVSRRQINAQGLRREEGLGR